MEGDGLHTVRIDASQLAFGASSVLAAESRMVVHVTVCTVYSRVLGILVINLEDTLDPLNGHGTAGLSG